MSIAFEHRKPDTSSGKLRTPITFYLYKPTSGPEPGEEIKNVLHECLCEIYNPSMKDLTIMETTGTKEAVTVRIRDTKGEYLPTNKHVAEINDYRYEGKVFKAIDVRPDLTDNRFITILLRCQS